MRFNFVNGVRDSLEFVSTFFVEKFICDSNCLDKTACMTISNVSFLCVARCIPIGIVVYKDYSKFDAG